jgi:hypothetical protein
MPKKTKTKYADKLAEKAAVKVLPNGEKKTSKKKAAKQVAKAAKAKKESVKAAKKDEEGKSQEKSGDYRKKIKAEIASLKKKLRDDHNIEFSKITRKDRLEGGAESIFKKIRELQCGLQRQSCNKTRR